MIRRISVFLLFSVVSGCQGFGAGLGCRAVMNPEHPKAPDLICDASISYDGGPANTVHVETGTTTVRLCPTGACKYTAPHSH